MFCFVLLMHFLALLRQASAIFHLSNRIQYVWIANLPTEKIYIYSVRLGLQLLLSDPVNADCLNILKKF